MTLDYRQPPALTPGYRLDRYELLCPIAEGGMASVWVARMKGKHGFERLVAVKTILPKFASDETFQTMFLDEARIASAIEHTNVAQILDLGEQHDVLFLVMEWVDGDALTKLLSAVSKRQKKAPLGIILRILADTCGGLHAAHELRGADGEPLGVVHRDVSPQNILVSGRGVAKLIDFGIAKARERSSGETSAGLVKGKIKYMAPEQALGKPLDRRVDVWAVGAILYRVLAGRPPFPGSSELEMLHALTSGMQPAPLPANVPAAIGDIAMRALRHDPAERFATAAEMQSAMEQAMVAAGTVATTLDVAAFAAEFLVDRATARKQTLELALSAARERERVTHLLQPTEVDLSSASGIVDVGSHAARVGSIAPQALRSLPPLRPPPPARPSPSLAPDGREDELTVALPPPPAAPQMAELAHAPSVVIRDADAPDAMREMREMREPLTALTSMSQDRRRRQLTMVVGGGVGALALLMLVAIAVASSSGGDALRAKPMLAAWKSLALPALASPSAPDESSPPPVAPSASVLVSTPAPTPTVLAPVAPPRFTPPAAQPPRRAPTAATPTAAPPRKPRVDDGF